MKTFFPKREIFHWQIGYVRKVHASDSSIIAKGVLLNPMQLFPLLVVFVGGEIVDMISNTGAVAKLVLLCAARVQPDFLGHHSDQMEPAAASSDAERALCAGLPQGAAVAGYRSRGRPIQAQSSGRRI